MRQRGQAAKQAARQLLRAKMPRMTETQAPQPPSHAAEAKPAGKSGPKIHRVCIGCNNMFEVTMDNYEAKHCPACHKG
jgi:membrane protease subunit (stomatin/prohibitin family)